MPSRAISLAVLLGTATAMAHDIPATDWREALAVEFEAVPPAPAVPAEPSPLRPGVPMPDFEETDSDVVLLPAMTVSASRNHRGLDKDIADRYRRLKSHELSWKGGPLIERKIGPLHFGVYSILYIPVAVGISW